MNVRKAFRAQAKACGVLGSPFTARLMALIGDRLSADTAIGRHVLNWPGDPSVNADSVPLRLAGALNALRIEGLALRGSYPPVSVDDDTLWSDVEATLELHRERIQEWLANPPQTNEVRRAAVIICALARLHQHYDRPVELLELGASGGLNLWVDRFRLVLPGREIGPPQASVVLQPDWCGLLPAAELPVIVSRRGVDVSPLDPASPADRLRLLAYIWPDQQDRIARTEAAIRVAARTPAEISADDAGEWLETQLKHPASDRLRIVFHTVAWQYFPCPTQERCLAAFQGAQSPVVQISMEADGGEGAAIKLTHWPEGRTEEIGRADFHGRWIDWR